MALEHIFPQVVPQDGGTEGDEDQGDYWLST